MFRSLKIKLLILAIVPILGFFHPAGPYEERPAAVVKDSVQTSTPANKLANGLYLVLRSAPESKSVEPLSESEKLVANDFHLLEPAERGPVVYLVLQTKPFVPFILGSDPVEDREEATGKPRLQLQLADDQKGPLEEFTRLHLGETVAIVIGGEVVTTHKVRTAITCGRFQITRCTKHGCETLYSHLLRKESNQ